MAANIFTGVTDSNWGTNTNWSLGAVPTANDGNTTTFNVTSPNCTVNTSNRVCNSIDFTGYTNTITMSFNITSSGNITLGSGMHVSGAGILLANATATLTSAGFVWPNAMQLNGTSITYTLGDSWTISGLLTMGGVTATTITTAGFDFKTNGGWTCTAIATFTVSGTGHLVLGGGTVNNSATNNGNITFAGNITIGSFVWRTGTLLYSSGTITVTGGTTFTCNATSTLNVSGITWNNVTLNGTSTITLSSDLNLAGTLNLGGTTLTTTINGGAFNLNAPGNVTIAPAGTTAVVTGSANLKLTGTGAQAFTTTSTSQLRLPTNIACSGTVTMSSTFTYNTGTFTYTSGTVIVPTTLTCAAATTFACSGITWNNATLSGTSLTWTFNQNFNCSGTLTLGGTTAMTLTNGGGDIYCSGSCNISVASDLVDGTAVINMTGTGQLAATAASAQMRCDVNINTSGTITLGDGTNTLLFALCTLTFTAGTVTQSASTVTFSSSCLVVNNINGLTLSGTVIIANSVPFSGTYGISFGTLSLTVTAGSRTITLGAGLTYTVTTNLLMTGTLALPHSIISGTGGSQAKLNLQQGATHDCSYCNATDIDSSGGLTIWSYKPTLSNTLNWKSLIPPPTMGRPFGN